MFKKIISFETFFNTNLMVQILQTYNLYFVDQINDQTLS
jgi:hypothetical protein